MEREGEGGLLYLRTMRCKTREIVTTDYNIVYTVFVSFNEGLYTLCTTESYGTRVRGSKPE